MRLLACLIVAPQRGYDEPAILSYAISSFCPTSADGLHGALASWDLDFLLPYATHLVRSTASTSSSNCLAWSTRCRISMTRQRSLTAALTYLSKCSAKTACPLRGRQRHAAKPDLGRDRG